MQQSIPMYPRTLRYSMSQLTGKISRLSGACDGVNSSAGCDGKWLGCIHNRVARAAAYAED